MFREIEFRSGWPEDGEFDEDGEPTLPDGRALAEALAAELRRAGVEVGPVWEHSYYGWAFRAWYRSCSFYSVFNVAGEYGYFSVTSEFWILRWIQMRRPSRAFGEFSSLAFATLLRLDRVEAAGSDAAQQGHAAGRPKAAGG
jgi:hypothetical protein